MNDEHINDASKKDSAWQYLQEIGAGERHFNEIESKYRALASTWLLAAFAVMGFVATSADLPIPKEIVMFSISLAGAIGIQLLWMVDLLGYHHLLAGCETALARTIGAMLALATIWGSVALWKRSRNASLVEEVGKLEEPAMQHG